MPSLPALAAFFEESLGISRPETLSRGHRLRCSGLIRRGGRGRFGAARMQPADAAAYLLGWMASPQRPARVAEAASLYAAMRPSGVEFELTRRLPGSRETTQRWQRPISDPQARHIAKQYHGLSLLEAVTGLIQALSDPRSASAADDFKVAVSQLQARAVLWCRNPDLRGAPRGTKSARVGVVFEPVGDAATAGLPWLQGTSEFAAAGEVEVNGQMLLRLAQFLGQDGAEDETRAEEPTREQGAQARP